MRDLAPEERKQRIARRTTRLGPLTSAEEPRWLELQDVLLADAYLCEDLMLPDPPPRPPGFTAPPAGDYAPPVDALLRLGPDGDVASLVQRVIRVDHAADLLRMARDEGLLRGWPTRRRGRPCTRSRRWDT